MIFRVPTSFLYFISDVHLKCVLIRRRKSSVSWTKHTRAAHKIYYKHTPFEVSWIDAFANKQVTRTRITFASYFTKHLNCRSCLNNNLLSRHAKRESYVQVIVIIVSSLQNSLFISWRSLYLRFGKHRSKFFFLFLKKNLTAHISN